MERILTTEKKKTTVLVAAAMAAGLLLSTCGFGGDDKPNGEAKVEVEKPKGENHEVYDVGSFTAFHGEDNNTIKTYQETYDFQGNHWDCSVSVSESLGQSGAAPAKSCVVTPIQPQTTETTLG